jgi:hypothetical protein
MRQIDPMRQRCPVFHALPVGLLLALASAAPAGADVTWRLLSNGIEAVARGGPVGLGVGCGVEGPGVWIEAADAAPDQEAVDFEAHPFEAGERRFLISVDPGASHSAIGDCAGGVCLLIPEPDMLMSDLIGDLRRGRIAAVAVMAEDSRDWIALGEVPLSGSARALRAIEAACPFR